MSSQHIFVVVILICLVRATYLQVNSTAKLTEYFEKLVKNLGHQNLSDEFEKLSNDNQPINGSQLIEELSTAVEEKFNTAKHALLKLRDATELYHRTQLARFNPSDGNSQEFPGCCDVGVSVLDFQHIHEKTEQTGCHLSTYREELMPASRAKNFSKDVFKVMKENLEKNKDLKWQYYASLNGSFYLYPAKHLESCRTFDPRKRSWYAQSSTLHAKDVVIAIDVSGSMEMTNIWGRTLLDIVKIGVNMVINTLNNNDRLGVVAFSNDVVIPEDFECYKRELAIATPQNKDCIKKFVNSLKGKDLTNYGAGLQKAFQYFSTSPPRSDEHRDRILLFLSDGMPTVGGDWQNISKIIKEKCAHKDITLLTYGIGKALQDPENKKLLTDMAALCPGEKANHQYLTEITSPEDMQNSVANYYIDLHQYKNREEPIFTLPYLDAGGLGLIMSMCLPVQNSGKFIGVVCTDIQIADLLSDVINFHQGVLSYAFLINRIGQTYFHPLLPVPTSLSENIGQTEIEALERDPAVREVIKSMKMGESGKREMETQRIVSIGATQTEGIELLWPKTKYLWTSIAGSNFSVCIVIASDEQRVTFADKAVESFIYHDFRMQNIFKRHSFSNKLCVRNKKLIQKSYSGIMFAQSVYKNVIEYRKCNDTESNITDIEDFVKNVTNMSNIVDEQIRGAVAFTAIASESWKKQSRAFVWRYVATVDGVYRMQPATKVNKLFDARKRQWFQRAVNQKGTTVLTSPYLDTAGGGHIISLARAVCKHKCERYNIHTPVVAVVGGDISLYYLHEKLIELQPICKKRNKCILVDNSGYIVMHDDFIFPSKHIKPAIESVHISVKEPNITKMLLQHDLIRIKACINVLTIRNRHYWQMHVSDVQNHDEFSLHPVARTNVFLIIKNTNLFAEVARSCDKVKEFIAQMSSNRDYYDSHIKCEPRINNGEINYCSCTSPANFDPCPNIFDYRQLSDYWPTCVPGTQHDDVFNIKDADISDYPMCGTECLDVSNSSDCYKTDGCMWCVMGSNGENLEEPFCSKSSDCYFGIIGESGPYGFPSSRLSRSSVNDDNRLLIGLSTLAAILSFIVVAIAFTVIRKRRKYDKKLKDDKSQLLGCTLRPSIIEMEKDNPSMVWGPMNSSCTSLSSSQTKEIVPLEKLQRPHSTSSSDSIHYLAQKVEALVHRLDSAPGSPLHDLSFQTHHCCSSRHSNCLNRLSSPPSEYSTLPRSTSFTSALSSRSSTLESLPSNPTRVPPSASSTMPRSSLQTFPEEQILNPLSFLRRKFSKEPSESSCSTCAYRQPSERTWPECNSGTNTNARNSSMIDLRNSLFVPITAREPSERSYHPEDAEWQDARCGTCTSVSRTSSLPGYYGTSSRRSTADSSSFLRYRNSVRRKRRGSGVSNRSSQSSLAAAAVINNLIQQSLEAVAAEQEANRIKEDEPNEISVDVVGLESQDDNDNQNENIDSSEA